MNLYANLVPKSDTDTDSQHCKQAHFFAILVSFCILYRTPYGHVNNVSDPGCLSRILIFIHPESQIQKRRGKIFVCPTIFCNHKYKKILNNFIFEQVKNFFVVKTLRIIITFYPKIWVWDPGSKGIGSRIRIRNTVCQCPDKHKNYQKIAKLTLYVLYSKPPYTGRANKRN